MRMNGKNVLDATTTLTLKVTSNDVKKAVSNDPNNCAIAKSLKRSYRPLNVIVKNMYVYVENEVYWERFMISVEDRKMIRVFDKEKYFRAGYYTLLVPSPSFRLGYKKGQSGTNIRPARSAATKNVATKSNRGWAGVELGFDEQSS